MFINLTAHKGPNVAFNEKCRVTDFSMGRGVRGKYKLLTKGRPEILLQPNSWLIRNPYLKQVLLEEIEELTYIKQKGYGQTDSPKRLLQT